MKLFEVSHDVNVWINKEVNVARQNRYFTGLLVPARAGTHIKLALALRKCMKYFRMSCMNNVMYEIFA